MQIKHKFVAEASPPLSPRTPIRQMIQPGRLPQTPFTPAQEGIMDQLIFLIKERPADVLRVVKERKLGVLNRAVASPSASVKKALRATEELRTAIPAAPQFDTPPRPTTTSDSPASSPAVEPLLSPPTSALAEDISTPSLSGNPKAFPTEADAVIKQMEGLTRFIKCLLEPFKEEPCQVDDTHREWVFDGFKEISEYVVDVIKTSESILNDDALIPKITETLTLALKHFRESITHMAPHFDTKGINRVATHLKERANGLIDLLVKKNKGKFEEKHNPRVEISELEFLLLKGNAGVSSIFLGKEIAITRAHADENSGARNGGRRRGLPRGAERNATKPASHSTTRTDENYS